jgi:hypothetical protein
VSSTKITFRSSKRSKKRALPRAGSVRSTNLFAPVRRKRIQVPGAGSGGGAREGDLGGWAGAGSGSGSALRWRSVGSSCCVVALAAFLGRLHPSPLTLTGDGDRGFYIKTRHFRSVVVPGLVVSVDLTVIVRFYGVWLVILWGHV